MLVISALPRTHRRKLIWKWLWLSRSASQQIWAELFTKIWNHPVFWFNDEIDARSSWILPEAFWRVINVCSTVNRPAISAALNYINLNSSLFLHSRREHYWRVALLNALDRISDAREAEKMPPVGPVHKHILSQGLHWMTKKLLKSRGGWNCSNRSHQMGASPKRGRILIVLSQQEQSTTSIKRPCDLTWCRC